MFGENELYKFFKNLKFKEEFIIIHPDLLSFYQFKFKVDKFWEILNFCIGSKKTYIVPTFNFKKSVSWRCNETPSESGYLTEYLRKISKKRTIHPIHSVSILGPKFKEIPDHDSLSSFGKNSTWEWLCENNHVRNLSIGSKFIEGATICHYSEEKLQVSYRKYIKLKQKVFDKKNKQIKKSFLYFARKRGVENNWNQCLEKLLKNKIVIYKKNKLDIPIFSMNAAITTKFIIKELSKNEKFAIE